MIEGVDKPANFQNGLAHWFTLFLRQQRGKFFFLLENRMARRQQHGAPLRWRHRGPFLECAFSGVDGAPDILNSSLGYGVNNFSGGGIAYFGGLSALGIDRFTRD